MKITSKNTGDICIIYNNKIFYAQLPLYKRVDLQIHIIFVCRIIYECYVIILSLSLLLYYYQADIKCNIPTKMQLASFQAKSAIVANQLVHSARVVKQCRICLQTDQQHGHQQFIKPCDCSGSVQFLHRSCLKKWIATTLSYKDKISLNKIIRQGVQCQLCKYPIKFAIVVKSRCRNCQKILNLAQNKTLFIIFIAILFILSSSGISLTSWTLSQALNNKTNNQTFVFYFSLCGLLLSLCFLAITVYMVIFEVFIEKYTEVGHIVLKKDKQKHVKSRKKVTPTAQQSMHPSLQMISYDVQ